MLELRTYGEVGKGNTKMVAVFSVEASIVLQIDSTSNYISSCKSRPIRLPSPGGAEAVPVVAVISV